MCEEGSIKGALVEVINALMSAMPNERKLAEQQLEALQVTEGNFSSSSYSRSGISSKLRILKIMSDFSYLSIFCRVWSGVD